MKKALEILKELHNKDIWVMQQLKLEHIQVYEAIKELEKAIKPKTCNECEWWDFNSYGIFKKCFNGKGNCASTESSFGCNRFKQKDNA